jgi:hypothetical protein
MSDRWEDITESLNGTEVVRVWTIQRSCWWSILQQRGVIHADGRRVCHHVRPAYRWMMEHMYRRIPGYTGAYPVWFWYSPEPDLRHSAHLERGERGLRIELELPRSNILLSDFQTWHCVLNRWHLSLSWRERREWDRKIRGFDPYRKKLPAPLESELQSTWERVFNIGRINGTKLWGAVDLIQGVTERALLSEVREVREFVAR